MSDLGSSLRTFGLELSTGLTWKSKAEGPMSTWPFKPKTGRVLRHLKQYQMSFIKYKNSC
jgi:hypothetical protein